MTSMPSDTAAPATADAAVDKFTSVFEYQVTFSDCDPAALAYYPRIIEWLDWASEHMWRNVGRPWHDFFNKGGMAGMPLLDVHISFKFPMRFGDKLTITTWIDAFEGRTFTVRHTIRNDGHVAAECAEKRAWVVEDPGSEKGIRAVPFPAELRGLFHRPAKG